MKFKTAGDLRPDKIISGCYFFNLLILKEFLFFPDVLEFFHIGYKSGQYLCDYCSWLYNGLRNCEDA